MQHLPYLVPDTLDLTYSTATFLYEYLPIVGLLLKIPSSLLFFRPTVQGAARGPIN